MPIMYEPRKDDGHKCKPPSKWYNQLENKWRSEHDQGTLWKCDSCGKYWESRKDFTLLHWYEVSKDDSTAQARIAKIEGHSVPVIIRDVYDDEDEGTFLDEFLKSLKNMLTFRS